jgi:hypothetical protein
MILLASPALGNSTTMEDADFVCADLVNQLICLISAFGMNDLLSCNISSCCYSKSSIFMELVLCPYAVGVNLHSGVVADAVFPFSRESAERFHDCGRGCLDAQVTALELVGWHCS